MNPPQDVICPNGSARIEDLELSPERQLLGLIDTAHESGGIALPWTGTANELKRLLCGNPHTGRDAEKLLGSWISATGCYLARLAGERVERLILSHGVQRWRILSGGQVD